MAKKYVHIRVYQDSAEALKQRLNKINQEDLRKIGLPKKKIPQIEFTNFLFNNPVFITDGELRKMAQNKKRGREC